jgi:mycofactocin precursor
MPDSPTEVLEPPGVPMDDQEETEIASTGPDEMLAADLLVEEISIDGMCGVY